MTSDVQTAQIGKTSTEVYELEVQFERAAEYLWQPGRRYSVEDVVRPQRANGFEYKLTAIAGAAAEGQSGNSEPRWKVGAGETVKDGSLTWTAQTITSNGTRALSSVNVEAPTGITASAPAQDGLTATLQISGGTYGAGPYTISVEGTLDNGEVHEIKIEVTITAE